jgi:arylsulfatase A-like enzyme
MRFAASLGRPAFGLVLLLLVAAPVRAATGTERPNVLLITVDTLRADRLGCYGAATARTPHVDALAREGTLFTEAACPMPATRPSHFTIFTSLLPRDHQVMNNALGLPEGIPTLTQQFRRAGYRTGGFVGVKLLDVESGASRGFDVFDFPRKRRDRDARQIVPRALKWMKAGWTAEGEPAAPFFLWVHLFDPHQPYAPSPPFAPVGPTDGVALPRIDWDILMEIADRSGGDVPAPVFDRALALYDGEVAQADHWIGVLLDGLRRRHVLDRTVVAFMADHGECFGHGVFFEHYNCLYDGATRVPLILRYPAGVRRGVRDDRVVELTDVAPTLLGLAGLAVPATFTGHSLVTAPGVGRYTFLERPLVPVSRQPGWVERDERVRSVKGEPTRPTVYTDDQIGLRSGTWKYVATGPAEELYHLPTDPDERKDVASQRPEVVAELRDILREIVRAHPAPTPEQPPKISDSLRETLRALGYMP